MVQNGDANQEEIERQQAILREIEDNK